MWPYAICCTRCTSAGSCVRSPERNDLAIVAAVALGRSRAASPLFGTVLFLTYDEAGDTRSLSPDQYTAVMTAFGRARAALTRAEALTAALHQQ